MERATVAGGCFWCTEAVFRGVKGVKNVVVGYAGGEKENPTYEEVSSGTTGHAEAAQIEFDPAVISYEKILEVFMGTHDPTTKDRQGPDEGTQYRSVIFYENEEQKRVAEKVVKEVEEELGVAVVTEVVPLAAFYRAEDYHQRYYQKNPEAGYCRVIIDPKMRKLREKYAEWVK